MFGDIPQPYRAYLEQTRTPRSNHNHKLQVELCAEFKLLMSELCDFACSALCRHYSQEELAARLSEESLIQWIDQNRDLIRAEIILKRIQKSS